MTNDSLAGMLMHGVIGYDANPMQLQLVFYAATVLAIFVAARFVHQRVNAPALKTA